MSIVQVKDIRFAYKQSNKEVLSGVDMQLEEGKMYVIFGPSGCGKPHCFP